MIPNDSDIIVSALHVFRKGTCPSKIAFKKGGTCRDCEITFLRDKYNLENNCKRAVLTFFEENPELILEELL